MAVPVGIDVMSKDDLRMWRGRFQAPTDERVQAFNASVDIDREFALEDVEGSVATPACCRAGNPRAGRSGEDHRGLRGYPG